ncbi:hypothetical protein [Helicobacter macacae]|uniref:hypothetical protein n=1 Tax=Helicobacter macacae TaxID=398626 RepID=UPI00054DD4E6|nr:hypothetical protein [Helicobacter macacae]
MGSFPSSRANFSQRGKIIVIASKSQDLHGNFFFLWIATLTSFARNDDGLGFLCSYCVRSQNKRSAVSLENKRSAVSLESLWLL